MKRQPFSVAVSGGAGLFRASLLLSLLFVAALPPLPAQVDYTWTFFDDGGSNYILTSVSSPHVYGGALPASDPTLNLILGRRYRVIIEEHFGHPFEILAKGGAGDVVLLAQGGTVGSQESTVSVAWVDVGDGTMEFTVSQELVDAMRAGGRTPGYRCQVHFDMNGDFDLFGTGSVIPNPIGPTIPAGTVAVELELVLGDMVSPLGLVDPGDGRMFVYDQAGSIIVLPTGSVALNLGSRLIGLNTGYDERGLLGMALHPDFAVNRKLYTYTSEPRAATSDFPIPMTGLPNHQSVVAEWVVSATDPGLILPGSRRELLRFDQPQSNHNGGDLHFGPDDLLYIATGDGGSADDQGDGHLPDGNAQSTENLLGKLLRIDVDGADSANGQYGIPADNPFVGGPGLDEIWAYGFRNPYRFSFDRLTGELYVGDVGQNKIEEITLAEKGKNHGWRLLEGSFFFDPMGGSPGQVVTEPVLPLPPGLVYPIAEYDHDDGIAVVGGCVYRGGAIPELAGRYVFGDFSMSFGVASGRLFYLDAADNILELGIGDPTRALGLYLKGITQDAAGEIYIFASSVLGPGGTGGVVYRLVRVSGAEVSRSQWNRLP